MRKTIIRSVSIIGIFFVLFAALIAVVRFYPYTYNFPAYPKITHTQSGAAGDPINMLFVGSKNQIMPSFQKAGWLIPDPITSQTSAKIVVDSLAHRSYPTAPVSNLSVFGRVQDLAFEKPTNDVQNRGHIRIWKTGTLINGQPAWVGAASYDSGIELSSTNHFPTHHIAPKKCRRRRPGKNWSSQRGSGRSVYSSHFLCPQWGRGLLCKRWQCAGDQLHAGPHLTQSIGMDHRRTKKRSIPLLQCAFHLCWCADCFSGAGCSAHRGTRALAIHGKKPAPEGGVAKWQKQKRGRHLAEWKMVANFLSVVFRSVHTQGPSRSIGQCRVGC